MTNARKEKAPTQNDRAEKINRSAEILPSEPPVDSLQPEAADAALDDAIDNGTRLGARSINADGSWSVQVNESTFYIFHPDMGVYKEFIEKNEKKRRRVCGPIRVAAIAINVKNKNWKLQIVFRNLLNVERSLIVGREWLDSPRELNRELLKAGFDMENVGTQSGNPELIRYLNKCPPDKYMQAVEKPGWLKLGECFVLPGGEVIGSFPQEILYAGDPFCDPKFERHGSLEEWQEKVAGLAWYSSRTRMGLCAAFAPVLLRFVSACEGGFHFVGLSGTGKSNILRAGVSVWSCADHQDEEGKSELTSWSGSGTGFEAFAEAHSDFAMYFDEIGSVKEEERKELAPIIYMLANGQGKRRSNRGLQNLGPKTWRAFFISAGEITLDTIARRLGIAVDEGARIRLANIPAKPEGAIAGNCEFPLGGIDDWLFGIAMPMSNACCKECYGIAGPEFVRHLIDHIQEVGGTEAFSTKANDELIDWVKRHASDGAPQIMRVARRFALAAFAGELAIKFGILPWEPGEASEGARLCFNAWRKDFEEAKDQSDPVIVMQQFYAAYQDHFLIGLEGAKPFVRRAEKTPHLGVALLRSQNDPQLSRLFLLPHAAQDFLKRWQLDLETVAKAFRAKGLLEVKQDGKARLTKKCRSELVEGMELTSYCVLRFPADEGGDKS